MPVDLGRCRGLNLTTGLRDPQNRTELEYFQRNIMTPGSGAQVDLLFKA